MVDNINQVGRNITFMNELIRKFFIEAQKKEKSFFLYIGFFKLTCIKGVGGEDLASFVTTGVMDLEEWEQFQTGYQLNMGQRM